MKFNRVKFLCLIIALSTAFFSLTSCGTASKSKDKFQIVVSTSSWGSLAKEIAGDTAGVNIILNDSNQNPHEYEASAADISKIRKANLAIYNGGSYDAYFAKALQNQSIPTLVALENMPTQLKMAPYANLNEHAFYSLTTAQNMGVKIYSKLVELDGKNKATYQKNWNTFNTQILALLKTTNSIKQKYSGTKFVQDEPLAGYLLFECGLIDATPEVYTESGAKEASQSYRSLNDFMNTLSNLSTKLLVLNAQNKTDFTKKIVEKAETSKVPTVKFSETLPSSEADYVTWQKDNLQDLQTALASNK